MARNSTATQPRVFKLEQGEPSGALTLKTMRQVAEALDCVFVYALVTRSTLEETVRTQARAVAGKRLHVRMFGNAWRWAGSYRKTVKNIGLPAWQIATELRTLCDDCAAWIEHGSYPPVMKSPCASITGLRQSIPLPTAMADMPG